MLKNFMIARALYTKLEWLFSRIFLFTLRAQRDRRSYTKLEWLFYRIFLFTLRAQRDQQSYTSTTDQCGARSGSLQLTSITGYLTWENFGRIKF